MAAQEEIGELGQVLLRAATAVSEAQLWLHDFTARRDPRAGAPPVLALPRVTVDLSFGLRIDKGRRASLVRRRRTEGILTHRLRFGVVATPEPPSPGPASFLRELSHPAFLLPDGERRRWRARLADALRSGERPERPQLPWRFPPREKREESKSFQREVAREGALVADSERMIFFRLPQDGVLAVRVAPGPSGRQDGLFVHEPQHAPRPWAIYNFEHDGAGRTHYRPLALLVESLRDWRAVGEPTTRSEATTLNAGISSLDTFQASLEDGLSKALDALSERRSEESPVGYLAFETIEARVSFSLGPERGVDLSRATTEIDPERDDLPASVVRIRIEPAAKPPRVTTELAELEYLLSGDDRRAAVDLLVEAASKEPLRAHRRLIEDAGRQDGAVVLRAFQKRRERLLVIWPAGDLDRGADDRREDLVFTCLRRWRGGAYEIGNVRIVKGPDDPMHRFALVNDADAADAAAEFQYRPFHRFFRAVLAWQLRGQDEA